MRCGPSGSGFRNGRLLRRRRGSRLRRARRLRPALTRSPIRDHKRESAKRPSRCAARSDSGTPPVNKKFRLDFEAGLELGVRHMRVSTSGPLHGTCRAPV